MIVITPEGSFHVHHHPYYVPGIVGFSLKYLPPYLLPGILGFSLEHHVPVIVEFSLDHLHSTYIGGFLCIPTKMKLKYTRIYVCMIKIS